MQFGSFRNLIMADLISRNALKEYAPYPRIDTKTNNCCYAIEMMVA